MANVEKYCFGCNEKYAVAASQALCPECDQELASMTNTETDVAFLLSGRQTLGPDSTPGEPAEDRLLGSRLGNYAVESLLGRGGMARVYRAIHLGLERPVALKVLSRESVNHDPKSVARFFAEARAAAALVHPNIVTVHNISECDRVHFIEMELVEGNSLARELRRRGRLDPTLATRLMMEVCTGLAEAHEREIVHRDLKPGNVLIDHRGGAKLADFGLAKRVVAPGEPGAGPNLAGTPHFMAPELFAGQPASPRSDVYAAGVTYFFLLTGRLPFVAASIKEVIGKHLGRPAPEMASFNPDAPERAEEIVRICLDKRPENRYAETTVLVEELRTLLGQLRSIEELVEEALRDLDAEWRRIEPGFVVEVRLEAGRRQRVFIEEMQSSLSREPLIRIYSPCAPVRESYYRRALELNSEVHHAAVAVQSLDGQDYFVMRNAYPRATCDPEELRSSVLTVAARADEVEWVLTGRDRH